jgi:hypothetical protein
MIKITKEIADLLIENYDQDELGFFTDFGAIIGDAEFIIYYKDDSDIPYLTHISEFEQDGFLIRLKDKKG